MAKDLKAVSHDPATSGMAEGDIVFECPMCNKAMVIGAEGAGEIVVCPACNQEVIVPGGPLWDEVKAQMEAEEAASAKGKPQAAKSPNEQSLSELRDHVRMLEHQLKENEAQRQSTADAIAHALNQATRFRLTLQRLEEKQKLLEAEITETRARVVALERLG